jgi:hypothetical protein
LTGSVLCCLKCYSKADKAQDKDPDKEWEPGGLFIFVWILVRIFCLLFGCCSTTDKAQDKDQDKEGDGLSGSLSGSFVCCFAEDMAFLNL